MWAHCGWAHAARLGPALSCGGYSPRAPQAGRQTTLNAGHTQRAAPAQPSPDSLPRPRRRRRRVEGGCWAAALGPAGCVSTGSLPFSVQRAGGQAGGAFFQAADMRVRPLYVRGSLTVGPVHSGTLAGLGHASQCLAGAASTSGLGFALPYALVAPTTDARTSAFGWLKFFPSRPPCPVQRR